MEAMLWPWAIFFTQTDGTEANVEYTFGYNKVQIPVLCLSWKV